MLLVVAATEPELRGVDVALARTLACGVGPVDAAARTAAALAVDPSIDAVLHVGIAGRRADATVAIGDLVLAGASRYCDTTSSLVASEVGSDARLLAAARAELPEAAVLVVGTSADVGGSSGCTVEAMEGFAVQRACELAGIPSLEVRAISNDVDEPDRERWQFEAALDVLSGTLPRLVRALAAAAT